MRFAVAFLFIALLAFPVDAQAPAETWVIAIGRLLAVPDVGLQEGVYAEVLAQTGSGFTASMVASYAMRANIDERVSSAFSAFLARDPEFFRLVMETHGLRFQ